jgi:hypothetical protein
MKYILIHKTNAHYEAGGKPSRELIGRVGRLIGDMQKANAFLGGEGLQASARGVRLTFSGGRVTARPGPFESENAPPSGLCIVKTASLDDAAEWATRLAAATGDAEIDVRPVNEPWDIGLMPPPEDLTTRRFMAVRKATAASEAGEPVPRERREAIARLVDESKRDGTLLVAETLGPSRRGRRYKNAADGVRYVDGPFAESKELIAGFALLSAGSLDEVHPWAPRYLEAVDTDEIDVFEVE